MHSYFFYLRFRFFLPHFNMPKKNMLRHTTTAAGGEREVCAAVRPRLGNEWNSIIPSCLLCVLGAL